MNGTRDCINAKINYARVAKASPSRTMRPVFHTTDDFEQRSNLAWANRCSIGRARPAGGCRQPGRQPCRGIAASKIDLRLFQALRSG
jgi:hypothetical protein